MFLKRLSKPGGSAAQKTSLPKDQIAVPHSSSSPLVPRQHEDSRPDSDPSLGSGSGNVKAPPLPKNILAFRSITTMLGSLRGVGYLNLIDTNTNSLQKETREELRVLVALATILVRNHEVVTVVELPQMGDVKTIACAHSDGINNLPESCHDNTPPDATGSQPGPTEFIPAPSPPTIWSLWTTKNFRDDDSPTVPAKKDKKVNSQRDQPRTVPAKGDKKVKDPRKLYVTLDT